MKKSLLSLVGVSLVLCGCSNPGVVEVSPNTFMLSREDHGGIFGNPSALKAGVIRDANEFAQKQGKVAVPVSAKEHPVGILGDWASFQLTFKVVDKNDPATRGPDIWSKSGRQGGQGWRNMGGSAVVYGAEAANADHEEQGTTVGQQLIDLQKAKNSGALTEGEYQKEKAKLLGH